MIATLPLVSASLWAQVTNFWQFETAPGFQTDSVGSATLSNSGALQATLPGSGRGSEFQAFSSTRAAEFAGNQSLSGSIAAITGNFTIEAFIHRDNSSGSNYDLIFATTNTHLNTGADIGINLLIRLDGAGGTSPNELILDVGDGSGAQTMQSNFIIPTGKDYYVAATFDLAGGQATFYVQNLTDGGSLLTSTASHTLTSIANRTGFYIGGHPTYTFDQVSFAGLIDEVRLSNGVLASGSLLVAIPEPGAYALLGGLVALLAVIRRRWRPAVA